MKLTPTTIRLDPQVKHDFYETCESFGMSASTAMTLFAKAVIREKKIPFEIIADTSLDEYVEKNKNYIKQGIDDLENKRYYTLKAGDLNGLEAVLDEVSDD